MEMSSNPNLHQRPLPSPRQQVNPSGLKRIPNTQERPCLSSWQVRKSRSDSSSTSSRETLPSGRNLADTPKRRKVGKEEASTSQCPKLSITRQVSIPDKISLQDVARERVDAISEWMHKQPEGRLKEVKDELQSIFVDENREEFLLLQKLVQDRTDLNDETLTRAHIAQLQIFVALNTGVRAFLYPNLTISHSSLVEIFLHKRCRNILCQSILPADGCGCEICTSKKGFCNQCMCVICSKYDFEANTCRWIGCESCSHWIHTECAVKGGQIGMNTITNGGPGTPEMVFKCPDCQNVSEMFEWIKDVFTECGPTWNLDTLTKELDFVSKIFHTSEDVRGRKLCCKCEDLLDKLRAGIPEATARKLLLPFFKDLEIQPSKNPETEENERAIAPQEACNQIAEVAQLAAEKLCVVANEKMSEYNKARAALEACDRELADKAREVAELKLQMQHEKKQVESLDNLVRL